MSDPFEKFKNQLKSNNRTIPIEDEIEEVEEFSLPEVDMPEEIKEEVPTPENHKFDYVFFPKQDITTYDLARILSFIQMFITPDIYLCTMQENSDIHTRDKLQHSQW